MPAPFPSARAPQSRASVNATRDAIVHLVGDLDDAIVAAIEATGAAPHDVEDAARWAAGDAEQLGNAGRPLSAAAQAVYDILSTEPSFSPPERDR